MITLDEIKKELCKAVIAKRIILYCNDSINDVCEKLTWIFLHQQLINLKEYICSVDYIRLYNIGIIDYDTRCIMECISDYLIDNY